MATREVGGGDALWLGRWGARAPPPPPAMRSSVVTAAAAEVGGRRPVRGRPEGARVSRRPRERPLRPLHVRAALRVLVGGALHADGGLPLADTLATATATAFAIVDAVAAVAVTSTATLVGLAGEGGRGSAATAEQKRQHNIVNTKCHSIHRRGHTHNPGEQVNTVSGQRRKER